MLIVANNSFDYIRVYFAALASRLVTVEVSPLESRKTLRAITAETAPWAVYTDVPDLAEDLGLPRIDVASWLSDTSAPLDVRASCAATKPTDLASIVYTSGTTGCSKGVMLSHENFLTVTHAIVEYLGIDARDRHLLTLPLFHTYGKSVLLTTAQVGGSICLFAEFAKIPLFLETLARERITIFSGVPFHINALLRRARLEQFDLTALKRVTVSGAPLHADSIAAFSARLPHVELFFMYGLTESCTRACFLPPRDAPRKRGSVGIPIRGVRVQVRDDEGRELPPSTPGDIFLAGPNIMQGYFNAPELTAQALHDGWLWTGDLGYLDAEGYLYITGRKKDILNCAGERISPREIEEVLESHPNVAEAAVIGVPDPLLGESICAVVVERQKADDATELRLWCGERLSYLKVPRSFRFIDHLPRTPSGKIRKFLLQEAPLWPEMPA